MIKSECELEKIRQSSEMGQVPALAVVVDKKNKYLHVCSFISLEAN